MSKKRIVNFLEDVKQENYKDLEKYKINSTLKNMLMIVYFYNRFVSVCTTASKPKEKLDIDNGFLMCPNHDKLFDKGYITFYSGGKIIISDRLEENVRILLNVDSKMHIEMTEKK